LKLQVISFENECQIWVQFNIQTLKLVFIKLETEMNSRMQQM